MSVILDYEQQRAVQLMLGDGNVFIHGRAGTGKSTVIKEYLGYEDPKVNVALLAFTGVAAIKLPGGSTIHRFFGFPAKVLDLTDVLSCKMDVLRAVETIIIDEISMVSSNLIWAMDAALKHATEKFSIPFGGKQIIVVGDFCQLPPVIPSHKLEEYFLATHRGTLAFQTDAWSDAGFQLQELSIIHRQQKILFQDVLDVIRCGGGGDLGSLQQALDVLNARCVKPFSIAGDSITLCQLKREAEYINSLALESLNTESCRFSARIEGYFSNEMLPASSELTLKLGGRVMILSNEATMDGYDNYANGDLGVVMAFKNTPDEQWVEVRLDRNGRNVPLFPYTWRDIEFEVVQGYDGLDLIQRVVGEFTQIPLKSAYATTIHKSQGSTLNAAKLKLGDRSCFAPGLLYVALSRLKSMESLTIDRPINVNDVIVSPDVIDFYEGIESRFGQGSLLRGGFRFNKSDVYLANFTDRNQTSL